jgi:Glycosyl hydrolase catalytic core
MKSSFSILPTSIGPIISEAPSDDGIEVIEETKCTSPRFSDEATVLTDCDDEVTADATRRARTRAGLRTMIAFSFSVLIGLMIVVATLLITKYPFHEKDSYNEMAEMLDACPQQYPTPPPFAGKKGVALGMQYDPMIRSLQPYWNYNWQNFRSANQPDDIEWVPMIWGGFAMENVRQRIETYVMPFVLTGQVKRIFGYNEPDSPLQSNIPVERALNIWPALESANVSLVSPSCAQPGGEWMQNFMYNSALNCQRIDWVGVHWYGMANFTRFSNSMKQYYEMYGRRPLVITEFAVSDFTATTRQENKNSRPDVLVFVKKAIPWLQQQDWIAGYAWFAFNIMDPIGYSSALFNTEGKLTVLGRYYQSVRNELPQGNQSIVHYGGWQPKP